MIRVVKRFQLGQIVATPNALEALERAVENAHAYLGRHASGDWGEVDSGDWKLNDDALKDGGRLLSAYTLADKKTRIWILTEAADDSGQRACTTIMLPSDY